MSPILPNILQVYGDNGCIPSSYSFYLDMIRNAIMSSDTPFGVYSSLKEFFRDLPSIVKVEFHRVGNTLLIYLCGRVLCNERVNRSSLDLWIPRIDRSFPTLNYPYDEGDERILYMLIDVYNKRTYGSIYHYFDFEIIKEVQSTILSLENEQLFA